MDRDAAPMTSPPTPTPPEGWENRAEPPIVFRGRQALLRAEGATATMLPANVRDLAAYVRHLEQEANHLRRYAADAERGNAHLRASMTQAPEGWGERTEWGTWIQSGASTVPVSPADEAVAKWRAAHYETHYLATRRVWVEPWREAE